MKINENTKRWMESQAYQDLIRQIQVDIYVGLKNGAPVEEVKEALSQLGDQIKESVKWDSQKKSKPFVTRVIDCPKCNGRGFDRKSLTNCPNCYGEGRIATSP